MMTKIENKNNNLFKWATKELSQDAIVAWLLNDDEIGYDLIKDMCPSLKNVDFDIENITTQKYSIDVLVELSVLGTSEKIAVIIEDKTDTYIHDQQMLRYIEKVSKEKKKYKKIIYVLFKTGCIYKWEREHYSSLIKKIGKGKRFFGIGDLNDRIDEKLIISGTYNENSIEIKDDVDVEIEEIYSLDKFKKFIERYKSKNKLFDEYYFFISNESNINPTDDDENYHIANSVSDSKGVKLRMIRPGGAGKREYEFCFCSEDFYSLEVEDTTKIKKISDNFLILPFIRKKTDDDKITYLYAINYNLIGNKNKLHGYVPYNQLKLKSKNEFKEFKNRVASYAGKIGSDKIDFKISDSDKDNRLLVLSFEENEVNQKHIEKLLAIAYELAKYIREG